MKRWLDSAIEILGIFSFISLVGYFLALHDIRHDYASPELWARAGQPLPPWIDPVSQCLLEWRMLQIGFLFLLAFHLLLFVRMLVRNYAQPAAGDISMTGSF